MIAHSWLSSYIDSSPLHAFKHFTGLHPFLEISIHCYWALKTNVRFPRCGYPPNCFRALAIHFGQFCQQLPHCSPTLVNICLVQRHRERKGEEGKERDIVINGRDTSSIPWKIWKQQGAKHLYLYPLLHWMLHYNETNNNTRFGKNK